MVPHCSFVIKCRQCQAQNIKSIDGPGSIVYNIVNYLLKPKVNYEAIYNAMFIVDTFVTETPLTQYSIESPNEVKFGYIDEITGTSTFGSFTMNDFGVVTNYGYLLSNEGNGASLFTSIDLNGNYDDFLYHAYVSYELGKDQGVIDAVNYAVASGYGQDLANFLDTFPGANPADLSSTTVKAGDGDYYYA